LCNGFTTSLSVIKKRLRRQSGAYYPLKHVQDHVEFVPGTKRVRFLNDNHDKPLEFEVMNQSGTDFVMGLVEKPDWEEEERPAKRSKQSNQSDSLTTPATTPSPSTTEQPVAPKRTTRVSKPSVALPELGEEEVQSLCEIPVQIPLTITIEILPKTRTAYHQFHRGKQFGETPEEYSLSVCEALGLDSSDGFKKISGDYGVDYADGHVAIRVFRSLVPQKLTEHFYQVAASYRGAMKQCQTRNAQTLHLGAKEYNPNAQQKDNGMATRSWMQDAGITKEQTKALLPELLFADKVLKQVSQNSYDEKMMISSKFRLAKTCFTNSAVNSTNCRIHRDFGVGLDGLMYAGKWAMGGDVIIPQLQIKIQLSPGDYIVMDSGLFHMVSDFQGTRFVAVFFTKTHNEISSRTGNVLLVPEELQWLSNDMFKE